MGVLKDLATQAATQATRLSGRFNDHVHVRKLSNGIHIATQRRFLDPKLRFNILIGTGSLDDPLEKPGMTHFLEHLFCDENTQQEFRSRGGYISAYTNAYETCIHGNLDNTPENQEFLEKTLPQILGGQVSVSLYEKEKEGILNEIGQSLDLAPQVQRELLGSIFKRQGKGASTLGTAGSVESITLEELQDFKKKHYVGPNIYIGFTGISDHIKWREQMQKALGNISGNLSQSYANPHLEPGDIRRNNDSVHQLYFSFNFPCQPLHEKDRPVHAIAENYLNLIIQRNFLEQRRVVYDVGAYTVHDSKREGFSTFTGNVRPEKAHLIAPLVAATLAEACENIKPEDFKIAREQCLDGFKREKSIVPFVAHSPSMLVDDMKAFARSRPLSEAETITEQVTPEDVLNYFQRIVANQPTIVAYGNSKKLHSYDEFVDLLAKERAHQRALYAQKTAALTLEAGPQF